MHLAFIHPFLYRYSRGIERYTVNLSNALVSQGIGVDILTWHWPHPLHWRELDTQVQVDALPTSRYYAAQLIVPFYLYHLLRHRYDMIYIHFADYGEATTLNLLRKLGRRQPYTIVLHFPYSQVPHRYHTLWESGLVAHASELVAVSHFVAREAEAFWQRSCRVIGHGVDTSIFTPNSSSRIQVRAQLGIASDSPMLLTVAALEERKGVQWMLQALPPLLARYPDLHYVVVGDGDYLESLHALVTELGVADAVHFVGATTDVAPYYQAADVFVILARGEASSMVSLEAMACGLPVVASCHPPFDELIRPEWGRQVDERTADDVANLLVQLLTSDEMRWEMGQVGRRYILKEHSWSQISLQYLELLARN